MGHRSVFPCVTISHARNKSVLCSLRLYTCIAIRCTWPDVDLAWYTYIGVPKYIFLIELLSFPLLNWGPKNAPRLSPVFFCAIIGASVFSSSLACFWRCWPANASSFAFRQRTLCFLDVSQNTVERQPATTTRRDSRDIVEQQLLRVCGSTMCSVYHL